MNDTNTLRADVSFRPSPHLLDAIRTIRASVGDGLNDNELTRFLRDSALPTEAGFAFLSFADGFVTLTVPPQDLTSWYPEKGWIVPEKERIARAIAEKYQLSLHEPPDVDSSYVYPRPDSANPHHHLELGNREETAILAHPHYLKVRLFGATSPILFARAARLARKRMAQGVHDPHYASKIATARFYVERLLPEAWSCAQAARSGLSSLSDLSERELFV